MPFPQPMPPQGSTVGAQVKREDHYILLSYNLLGDPSLPGILHSFRVRHKHHSFIIPKASKQSSLELFCPGSSESPFLWSCRLHYTASLLGAVYQVHRAFALCPHPGHTYSEQHSGHRGKGGRKNPLEACAKLSGAHMGVEEGA